MLWRVTLILALAATPSPPPPAPDPAGTYRVHVEYSTASDVAVGVDVTLVGYAMDGKVLVTTRTTDRAGDAVFARLDARGATGWYAMALVPRKGALDRVAAFARTLDKSAGIRGTLYAD